MRALDLPHECRAFWIEAQGQGAIRTAPLPRAAGSQVLVRTRYSAVSRGTESLVFSGNVPESVASAMRAPHQQGDFPWPVKYGYSSVGRVLRGPEDLVGRDVFCLYPHQDAYVVEAAQVHVLPDSVPPARAVLAANMETALNGIWDAEMKAGDDVVVVGAGVVGCLVAYLAARHPGTRVQLVDIEPSRRLVADALGCTFASPPDARRSADVVFHTSGQPEGLATALGSAGDEARVIELSWYGTRPVAVALGERFHSGRLSIRGSQVGQLPPAQRSRWDYGRRLAKALQLCADPALDALIDDESDFSRLPETMKSLSTGGALCHRIRYG